MPVNKQLLEILCCPKTRVGVKELTAAQIEKVNAAVVRKEVKYTDGKAVDKPLQEGLITEDGKIIYRVDEEIPIMLIDMGIPAEQVNNI
ncbi:MAG TPA: hypothetical protein PLP19_13060 [bacterium]|nr:hypothetical protein [bacterium]HPN44415.1 hypothetical protein [bacterium]